MIFSPRVFMIVTIGSILIVTYNAVFSFLPQKHQHKKSLRVLNICCAIIILVVGILGSLSDQSNYTYAYVSGDRKILESKNFPWKIEKTIEDDNSTIFQMLERYGDTSDISVKTETPVEIELYRGFLGICIRFKCQNSETPNFKIRVK